MLEITLPAYEGWDEKQQEFVSLKEQTLKLEHSLVSLSKWESKYHKAFVSKEPKTFEETLDYIKFMTLTQNVSSEVYNRLDSKHLAKINEYIADPMTATVISEIPNGKVNREVMTAEVIYYYMIALNIPVEFQKWHLNRLLTLIKVCNIKNSPPKKRSSQSIINQYAALNAARRKQFNSKG